MLRWLKLKLFLYKFKHDFKQINSTDLFQHDERNWATVHGGELDSGSSESELVTFRNHPLKNGQKVRSYAAL